MADIVYAEIPKIDQWKKDSSVTLAVRNDEPGLSYLDNLVAQYATAKDGIEARGPLLIDMFLTIEYWFKMRETSPRRVHEGRLPAVRALFAVVGRQAPAVFRRSSR